MATYGNDLTAIDLAEAATNWTELNSPYNAGGTPALDGENWIQGQDCVSQTTGSKSGLQFSIVADALSDISGSFSAGDVVLLWSFYAVGSNLATFANGGMRVVIASDLSNGDAYKVGGSDYARNPYGGWMNVAVDPTKTADYTIGSGNGGAWRYFGTMPNTLAAIAKGTPHAVDAIRYGRGEIYCTGTGCTFTGMAQYNDYNDATNGYNRFGLFSAQGGVYLWKGLMSLGQSGTSCTFSDANKDIIIDDTTATYAAFNRIAIRNASSSVTWTNIKFKALGTFSPGEFEMVENATFVATGCTFQGMNTFTFLSNGSATSCIWNSCNTINAGGADFTGSSFLTPTVTANTSAVIWNSAVDPANYLDDTIFTIGGNAHHAIEFGLSSPTTINLSGCTFTGFSASNNVNDSTFHIKRTSGTVTINLSGCTGNFSYRTDGATVVISAAVSVTFDKMKDNTEVRVYKTSDDSVVGGIENATAGSPDNRNFTWSATAGTNVYYHIINKFYEQITRYGYVVPSTNTTLDIAQKFDRNYSNPP